MRNSGITGKFADEIEMCRPFEFFLAQASVTVEASSPTFYRRARVAGKADDDQLLAAAAANLGKRPS